MHDRPSRYGDDSGHRCARDTRWTVEELAGDHEIVCLDLKSPERSPYETVEYLAMDVTEQGPVCELCLDIDPDCVVHLAAVPGAGHRAGEETSVHNITSTYSVLSAAGAVGADVVWSSSEATYGVTYRKESRPLDALPVDKSHPQRPEDAYGILKMVGESIAERTARRHGVPVTSLQFS